MSALRRALEIERQIRRIVRFSSTTATALWHGEATKFAARKEMDVIHIGISAEQRRELGINHPRNLGARVRIRSKATAGRVWTTSPSELGLMIKIDLGSESEAAVTS